ncbi:jg18226 [Pararge aegeria aegeria]|uniref:Jg18226 protein n=1 Tax=Pararge aegeria aegeria TaxID=348720 RepID=A0A8S4REI9_9NEOP|nr:jg18226 [Pararge aegeria aegeria]
MWRTVAILVLAVSCHALPAQDTSHSENDIEGFSDCLKKDSTSCLKYKFFSFVDKMMGQKDAFSLTDGVTVVRASDLPPETGAPRSLDPVDKVKNYFETHSLRVEVKGSDVIDTVTSVGRALEDTVSSFTEDNDLSEEGRGKKKKAQKILGPLLAAVMLKMMALMPLAIGAIALIAGKALLIGKLALVLSAIIGLKKLLSQQKHVTYEVVAHPQHSSSHSSSHDYAGASGYGGDSGGYSSGGGGHGGGGWGRSADAQSLAYSAQKH